MYDMNILLDYDNIDLIFYCQDPNGRHYLYAFDFDHTLLDDNSDTAIADLLQAPIPDEINNIFNGKNWTEFMDRVMKYIAAQGVTSEQIYRRIQQLKFLPGEYSQGSGNLKH
jgi:hypothetical protein